MANRIYLFDTSIFISYLRNANPQASIWIQRAEKGEIRCGISVITQYELLNGARDDRHKKEARLIINPFQIHPINRLVAQKATDIFLNLPPNPTSTRLHLDILIAATAEYFHCDILTLNVKDFQKFTLQKSRIITL